MSSFATSAIAFGCVTASLFVGMFLRRVLPERHLATESKDVMKLGMGLIGTMAALVLGLMVGSAKSAYDFQKNNLLQMSVKLIILDRGLAHYGPETKEVRAMLRASVARVLAQMWPDDRGQGAQLDPRAAKVEAVYDELQSLTPKTDAQRSIQTQALTNGVLGIWISPSNGRSSSRIKKSAPATDRAHSSRTTVVVGLGGAIMPKPAKMTLSQKTSTIKKGVEMALPDC